ncbi:transposase [Olsenella sp. Marseille-P4559]|uniref:transposase n=1 Tax=Olsenella sp. Marseille-P4559 TaxID=2364795 RepID=UPI001A912435|nr:transposase [Olsenella sp. Marseille-P4559]
MDGNMIGGPDMDKEAGIKPNFSDIARRYGVDRHTVAKYWAADGSAPEDGRAGRRSGFDGVRGLIEEKAALPGVTARGIYGLPLDRRGEGEPRLPGHSGSAHHPRTRGIVPGRAPAEPHPRFETPPGAQLQLDWKGDVTMHDADGAECSFNACTSTPGYSRCHFFEGAMGRTRDTLLRCMADSIAFLGGVPAQWPADDMSAIATFGADGTRARDRRVLAFARDAGFDLVPCRPRSPEAKGRDESSNRFLGRLAAYGGDFSGWDGLDRAIARIRARSNEGPNRTTGLPPEPPFRREKDLLGPAPPRCAPGSLADEPSWQVVPPTMPVGARGRESSVPRSCIGHRVGLVVLPGGELLACDGGRLVAEHDTAAGSQPIACDEAHYVEALAGKRWATMDGDIAEAARGNLELLGGLGGESRARGPASPRGSGTASRGWASTRCRRPTTSTPPSWRRAPGPSATRCPR